MDTSRVKTDKIDAGKGGWVFSAVYKTTLVRRLVFVLVLSFLIQPLHRAYAEESEVAPASVPEEVQTVPAEAVSVEIPVPPVPDSTDLPVEAPAPDLVIDEAVESAVVSEDEATTTPVTSDAVTDESIVVETSLQSTSTEAIVNDESASPLPDTVSGDPTELTDLLEVESDSDSTDLLEVVMDSSSTDLMDSPASSTVEEIIEVVSEYSSTTTTASSSEDTEPNLPLVHESFGDGEVRFKKDDCVQVDDGSYYCQPAAAVGALRDAVLSAPDAGGDLEIFLVKNGEYIQLTNNDVDDSAPYYDSQSKTMVWHQFSGDNYTVQSFDFETGESAALTEGVTNDMEPARYDDITVWQRWVDGVWQIMLLKDGEVTQLTEGTSHHLTPSVYDGLVLWRTVEGSGVKVLESYDLKTGKHTIFDDPEEAAMVNPRMVMVYEAVYDNGDRVTRGVDIETGKIISLDTLPVDLPDTLPESDATGETRALIQSKPGTKETGSESIEPVPVADPPTPIDPFTLIIASTTDTSAQVSNVSDFEAPPTLATTTESILSTEFELVIPPATSTQAAGE